MREVAGTGEFTIDEILDEATSAAMTAGVFAPNEIERVSDPSTAAELMEPESSRTAAPVYVLTDTVTADRSRGNDPFTRRGVVPYLSLTLTGV
ncbi:hypothetical protein IQ62_01580 [Streptomyces scabiei]|uniref:hypothetical protein n=1 Tax=Streptomyces scabiei TaxID=1930 RepID=UPI0004E73444|nr:hypothetical protein [Streptomyces scabiei]KFG02495.1 hypothetical protein IQ62_01580 [Streptomyces scabiei]